MKIISTDDAPQAIGPYNQGIKTGNLYFFSGQIALRADGSFVDGDIKQQTIQVLKNIHALLNTEFLKSDQVVKTTIFLTDMADFLIVNELYADFFGEHHPARSTVQVAALPKNALIEIEVIASA